MLSVCLNKMHFHAPVGLYEEEAILKNELEIDLKLRQDADIDNLPYIDYTILYDIVQKAVEKPTELLETLIQEIVSSIKIKYPKAKITISIKKLNPPISGNIQNTEVKWED